MRNRELLMLAKEYDPSIDVRGWYMSEKLDGMRAFWDGGSTRGKRKTDVWWANNDKDGRYVHEQICTGLWSRYGNVVHAPDWWLDMLPKGMLDGELWMGRGRFQDLVSVTKTLTKENWEQVLYRPFDMPTMGAFLTAGTVNNQNYKKAFPQRPGYFPGYSTPFDVIIKRIYEHTNGVVVPVKQERIRDTEHMLSVLDEITTAGGEGLILRAPSLSWTPYRVGKLLKVKPFKDDEGTVVGYVSGRVGKEGRLHGKLGALVLSWKDKVFELSGYTDAERELDDDVLIDWAINNPGKPFPSTLHSRFERFKLGSKITFRYRELTRDGVPKEARYWRKYNAV